MQGRQGMYQTLQRTALLARLLQLMQARQVGGAGRVRFARGLQQREVQCGWGNATAGARALAEPLPGGGWPSGGSWLARRHPHQAVQHVGVIRGLLLDALLGRRAAEERGGLRSVSVLRTGSLTGRAAMPVLPDRSDLQAALVEPRKARAGGGPQPPRNQAGPQPRGRLEGDVHAGDVLLKWLARWGNGPFRPAAAAPAVRVARFRKDPALVGHSFGELVA